MSRDDDGDLRRQLAAQRAELDVLTDDVRDLTDAITSVADQLMPGMPVAGRSIGGLAAPWCWRELDDEAAARLWHDLEDWVAWLRGRYPIAEQLPVCWARHSELVEELTALRAMWSAAYLDPGAHPSGACDFHDRWLPGVLARVRSWGIHCTAEHRDRAADVYGEIVGAADAAVI